jgi:hypothetical protein
MVAEFAVVHPLSSHVDKNPLKERLKFCHDLAAFLGSFSRLLAANENRSSSR